MDPQQVEIVGRNLLIAQLVGAGLEVALPLRDRGVDLIAYTDGRDTQKPFAGCPIQVKASSKTGFGIRSKYSRFHNLLIVHVWHVEDPQVSVIYATTYPEIFKIAEQMGWTKTDSWTKGAYSNTSPGKRLCELLEPYKMTLSMWPDKVVKQEVG